MPFDALTVKPKILDTLPRGAKKGFKKNKNNHYDIIRKIVSLKSRQIHTWTYDGVYFKEIFRTSLEDCSRV